LDRSPDGVVVFDLEGRTIYCNEAYLRLTNAADRGTVLNVLSREFYADPDQDRPLVIRRLEAESTMEAHEIRVPESWAPVKWVELSVRQVKLDGHACFVSTVRDVGRRKKLEHERERIISVQQMLNETVLAGGLEEMIRSACERLAKVYGADWSGVALLQSDDEGEFFQYKWSYLVPPEIESIRFDRDGSSSLTSIVAEKGYAVVGDYQVEGPDAIPRRVESVRAQVRAVEAVALRDRQGDLVGVLSLFSSTPGIFREGVNEISLKLAARDLANLIEAKTLEDEIRLAGITDSLTGLYNTRHFYRRLSEEMNRARRTGAPLTVMLFDLDNFKEYNDSAGHVAGDHLLRRVGEIVTVSLRVGSDSAYRYGGDEFVALLPDTNVEGARRVALRISKKVRESKMAEVTVSLGMAEFQGEASPEELVRRADRAMYRAKESGKDRIMIDRPGEP
jgi:diguanylate cyclase (GGDEF)-like protein/PAS domain S-box-containing protein